MRYVLFVFRLTPELCPLFLIDSARIGNGGSRECFRFFISLSIRRFDRSELCVKVPQLGGCVLQFLYMCER